MSTLSPSMQLVMVLCKTHSDLLKPIESSLSTHGINYTELMVMYRLSQSPNLTLRRIELANAVNLSASGVTRLLLPMEKIKLVEKQANSRDARVSLVKLTSTGQQVLADALESFKQSAAWATQSLDAQQLQQCLQLLTSLQPQRT
ncbi:MarR family winged helix-turn-helix transcriptional regulator [Neptunicella sp. SCSIO 80796]|uniref:MarR family winged helix-turn-helix transcriptional regulator n=1 Tax=Neptunicella plasticusilytica TaxID=3117012 RepID=UPI003A4DF74E